MSGDKKHLQRLAKTLTRTLILHFMDISAHIRRYCVDERIHTHIAVCQQRMQNTPQLLYRTCAHQCNFAIVSFSAVQQLKRRLSRYD